jgi:Mrp family chromosome partitioning ATPase
MDACPAKQQANLEQQDINKRMAKVKHKLLVFSGKGGVGKSTVSANLALSLAAQGYKVGLLDVDVHGPSIPQLLGVTAAPEDLAHPEGDGSQLMPVAAGENLRVMSVGFLLENRDTAVIWRGPMKYKVIKQFLKDVDWGDLDYLVVDSPPGTGDEPLSVAQLLEGSKGAVIVTTPQDLAISDVRKCVTFCGQLGLPVAGVIENMSGFVCPSCGERVEIFKSGGGEKMAEEMGIRFLGKIPLDPRLVEAGDSGEPYMQRFSDTEVARSFKSVVDAITAEYGGE